MTREELKEHCKRQIQQFERVEKIMSVTLNDWKRYEEHKLILELLEQEPVIDKIRAEIEEHAKINQNLNTDRARALCWCLDVIDKCKAESKKQENGNVN